MEKLNERYHDRTPDGKVYHADEEGPTQIKTRPPQRKPPPLREGIDALSYFNGHRFNTIYRVYEEEHTREAGARQLTATVESLNRVLVKLVKA